MHLIVFADTYEWPNNAKAAIVLTYDDALASHLDTAIPQLDRAGMKGTFYLNGSSGSLANRIQEWRAVAKNGHELANHLLYHPCRKLESRPWVAEDYDMIRYSLARYVNEIKVSNTLLRAIDGQTERTFAYTCGDTTVGKNTSIVEAVKPLVIAARAVAPDGFNNPRSVDFYNIRSKGMTEKSGDAMIALAEQAMTNNQMLVYLFHGVGAEHLAVTSEAHQKLVSHLNKNKADYWVTTMREAVRYLQRKNN